MTSFVFSRYIDFNVEGFEHDLDHAILYDPKRKAIAYNTTKYTPLKITDNIEIRNKDNFDFPNYVDFRSPEYDAQDQEYIINAKEIKPGLVRIYGSKKEFTKHYF